MSGVHLLEFILVVAILALVGIPLFSRRPARRLFTPADPRAEEYKHLLVRKEEILLAIKELDFDLNTGKVSEEDYESTRNTLEAEALAVMERIDQLEKQFKKKPAAKSMDAA